MLSHFIIALRVPSLPFKSLFEDAFALWISISRVLTPVGRYYYEGRCLRDSEITRTASFENT